MTSDSSMKYRLKMKRAEETINGAVKGGNNQRWISSGHQATAG